jgi:hypothetical protein
MKTNNEPVKKEGDPYLLDYDDEEGGMEDWDNTE